MRRTLLFTWLAQSALGCAKHPVRHEPETLPAAPPPSGSSAPLLASAASDPALAAPPPGPGSSCPSGMALLPGGSFWVGADPSEHYSDDESPRFRTTLPPFCLDQTEVTVSAYSACVTSGACTPAVASHSQCNAAHHDRPDFPINCVTWAQADAFCATLGQRLPSEVEWEFAARGGEQYLKYPWGSAAPDGHACWKHGGGSCKTKSYPAGAFGLFDLSGNVWEWTDDWYAAYPWPAATGFAKVYRGGSWSRRFEKWMHTRLRDRAKPSDQGAHLGFRCGLVPDLSRCAFGKLDDKRCLPGVNEQACAAHEAWNGVRCAKPSAPRCPAGRVEQPGRGCVLSEPEVHASVDLEAQAKQVQREPAPDFTADCQANFGVLTHAFRYFGGTHEARNLVSHRVGCKNRDVGVGWNSTCCP